MEFSQFVAEQDARNTIQLNIRKYCLELIDTLKESYTSNVAKAYDFSGFVMAQKDAQIDFIIETKRKYHKIIQICSDGSTTTHAFVDRKTGEVYKPKSCKSPAKGVRFDLRLIRHREWLYKNADFSGVYLYKGFGIPQ